MADKLAPDYDGSPPVKRYPNMRPKQAASLILADISDGSPRFLMGERSMGHVFLPGYFVFPGGRLERSDYRKALANLHHDDAQQINKKDGLKNRADALLNCAIRETSEETGLSLEAENYQFRYLARAITPPGHVRRYDTRFFISLVERDSLIAPRKNDGELLKVDWFDPNALPDEKIHAVTKFVLNTAMVRLKDDKALKSTAKTPVRLFRGGKAVFDWE